MDKIYLLTDYKGFFGNKAGAVPYRSGMNKELVTKYFAEDGYTVEYVPLADVDLRNMHFKNQYVLYTSSEDDEGHYKDYIEDVVYALYLQGARVIPDFKYLRAHHNKVFMEMLRDISGLDSIKTITSRHFGTLEELRERCAHVNDRIVIKSARGAVSRGVFLSRTKLDLLKKVAKVSRTKHVYSELWDLGRSVKRRGYTKESRHRGKFIAQDFLPGLTNDWKILIFGDKYYVLCRQVRKNDFRASGSGLFEFRDDPPEGLLDFARGVFDALDVPQLSIDVAFKDNAFHLFEFQAVYFGTFTLEKSQTYFSQNDGAWSLTKGGSVLEKEYVRSITDYIAKRYRA
jgi:glutathione synthase/RimK-type ligase-like ATP-grasp enzyme